MTPPKEILVLHHTHVDIGYTHPQDVVWELHNRHLDEAIDLCERTADHPEGSRLKWTCEVTSVAQHWLRTASAEQIERMRRLVASGAISFGAMQYHWTALHPEDLLRESLQGIHILRDALGADIRHAMQTDVNGTPWSVPDMLLDAGVRDFMMSINIHMGGFPLTRPLAFRWKTPSGRDLTVFSGEHYNAFTREADLRGHLPPFHANREEILDRMEQGLNRYFPRLRSKGWQHDFAVLTATHPAMDDNGPPNPLLPELIRHWNESGRTPFIRIVSLPELFDRIHSLGDLPVHAGDWTDYWTNGVAASALDVVMSRRAHGALWSARALETILPPDPVRTRTAAAAADSLHLANEHTWNVFASTGALGCGGSGRIEPIPEAEQRLYQSNRCASALSHARMARRDALDALAGNPTQSTTEDALLVFNPSEIPRQVCLRVPTQLLEGRYHLVAGTKHRFDVIEDILADTPAAAWAGPVAIPPLSHLTLPLTELSREFPPSPGEVGADSIMSPFWKLSFRPETGSITSLVHLPSGAECFDSGCGHDLFGPVRESLAASTPLADEMRDPRAALFQATEKNFDEIVHEDGYGWMNDWTAGYETPGPLLRLEAVADAEGIHLHREFTMPGILGTLRLSISLLRHEDRVRFTAFFNKADVSSPESLFFAFPLRLSGARAHFDTGGVVAAFDREQLPGASRGWITAGSMVAVESDHDGCLTLACPDAPLFQIGGFNYGRKPPEVASINQGLLLAWPMNNYWNTNFRASQPGLIRFRYELTRTPAFDPAASVKFAASVSRPVVFHPVVSGPGAPPPQTLLDAIPDGISVTSLKPGTPGAILLTLRNHLDHPVLINPAVPGCHASEFHITDPTGSDDSPAVATVTIPARSALTVKLLISNNPKS